MFVGKPDDPTIHAGPPRASRGAGARRLTGPHSRSVGRGPRLIRGGVALYEASGWGIPAASAGSLYRAQGVGPPGRSAACWGTAPWNTIGIDRPFRRPSRLGTGISWTRSRNRVLLAPGIAQSLISARLLPLRDARPGIVVRVDILQAKWPHRRDLGNVATRFRPMEVGRIAGQNNHGARWIRFQRVRIELLTQSNVENTGDHGVDSILRVPVRHQLHTARYVDPDRIGARLRRMTDYNGEANRRWKRWERLPFDRFRQDRSEMGLSHLMGTRYIFMPLPVGCRLV